MAAWELNHSDISANGRHGVVFADRLWATTGSSIDAGATVNDCSIANNTGLGIQNNHASSYCVRATGVWWGDPAGPAGPMADGVSDGVDSSSPRSQPPTVGY